MTLFTVDFVVLSQISDGFGEILERSEMRLRDVSKFGEAKSA